MASTTVHAQPDPYFSHQDSPPQTRWAIWLVVLLLSIGWHWFLLKLPPFYAAAPKPPRVEVTEIDPQKLETIRKKWQREKQLLIRPNQPKSQEAPADAKYMADRNIRVEKEQRAKQTQVLPTPGSQARPKREAKPRAQSKASKPPLQGLGVAIPLTAKPATPEEAQEAQPATPGGAQELLDRNLPEGSENLLNAEESVFYTFYARLYEAIAPIWQSRIREVPYRRRVVQGEYTTQVEVIFDREGALIGVKRIQTSGIPEFDQAVDQSWYKIGRFPNPPRGLLKEDGLVHTGWTFTVRVGAGFNLDYLPPERTY